MIDAKNKAMLEAAKALATAASSLASAAEALNRMCQYDEGVDHSPPLNTGAHLVPPSICGLDYEDSDDEYMIEAREQIRIEIACMPGRGPDALDLITGQTLNSLGKMKFPTPPDNNNQPDLSGVTASDEVNGAPTPELLMVAAGPNGEQAPIPARAVHTPEHYSYEPEMPTNALDSGGLRATASTFQPRTWAQLASQDHERWQATPGTGHSEMPAPTDDDTVDLGATNAGPDAGTGTETPTRTPFQNLIRRWPRPTRLQKDMLESLRTERDMLVCHKNLKSQSHAILVHCMEALADQPQLFHPEGIISALIIVPQQTTGRLYLNFANKLFVDFGLPHKALLLPGGNSDIVTESERMASERIDILISSPRVFINHVNSNPSLRIHLANLQFMIFPDSHELIKKDEFLNYQFNMIKKRMPTRAKSPRQIIIASSGSASSEQMEKFITRAFAPNPALIDSSSDGDEMLDMLEWQDLLRG